MLMHIYIRFDHMLDIVEVNSPQKSQFKKKNLPACRELDRRILISIKCFGKPAHYEVVLKVTLKTYIVNSH